MSASTIQKSVREEQLIITKRCEEIDKFAAALEDERKAYVERSGTLQALLELYEHTERSIEESKAAQNKINADETATSEFESITTPRLATL